MHKFLIFYEDGLIMTWPKTKLSHGREISLCPFVSVVDIHIYLCLSLSFP